MKKARKPPVTAADPNFKTLGRDELNLAEFPIASLSHRVPDDCKQLVFEDEIRDQSSGEVIPRRLTVTAHATLGLPNSLDDDVIVVLMHLTKERNNFTSRTVPFSRIEVVELLGWPKNGQSFDRLEESLSRWHGVSLRYDNAWWDKAAQAWRNEEFHILDNVSSFGQKPARRASQHPDQTALPLFTFTWNEVVFRSFQAGNLKSINLTLYLELSLAQSRRAYRFLDKRFYRESELRFDLKSFACGKIGFSQAYSAAKIKEKLQPALDELEEVGFLAPMSREKRYEKVSHGTWRIVFVRGTELKELETESVSAIEPLPLVSELTKRGVTAKSAAELVREFPAAFIESKIEEFDWEMKQPKPPKKPAGYLVTSIRAGYAADPKFISTAETQRQAEAKHQAEQRATEEKQRIRRQEQAEAAQQEQTEAYWKSLSPDRQQALDAQALAAGGEAARTTLETLKGFRGGEGYLTMLRRDYIRQLLQATAVEEPA